MNFVDEVEIFVKAGDGGNGAVSFRREKYVPRGGPDGGDGGRGGNIIFRIDPGLNTLQPFRHKRRFVAENGRAGRGKNQHGRSGKDLVVRVPPGTIVKDKETGLLLSDLTYENPEWIAARGGRGGKGNARFATPTNQAPRFSQEGKKGQERHLKLELKLLADVGLVGAPNAGKSTLLSRVTSARPKIADYPFTTLIPQLGVVELGEERSFVMADIPGLIEGAHKGAGMGIEFLRHIERTAVVLHLVDISEGHERAIATYDTVRNELLSYQKDLAEKEQIVALNKMDVAKEKDIIEAKETLEKRGIRVIPISAYTGQGLGRLLDELHHLVIKVRKEKEFDERKSF